MTGAGLAALITAFLGGIAGIISAVAAAISVVRKRNDPNYPPMTLEEKAKEDLFNEYRLMVDLQRQSLGSFEGKIKELETRIERERAECHKLMEAKESRIKILETKVLELGG